MTFKNGPRNGWIVLGTSWGAEQIRREVCPRTGGVVQNTGLSEMYDAERFPLGERQFFKFAFSLIGFRLAVRRTRQLVVGMDRVGGPLVQAIIGARRAYELHHAQSEQEEKHTAPDGTDHHHCPQREVGQPYHDERPLCNCSLRLC